MDSPPHDAAPHGAGADRPSNVGLPAQASSDSRTSPPSGASPKGASPPSATKRSALLGAVFLMATSAIGPGFLTQTATFTAQLGAAFAFAIVVSILLDIAIQLNVWRVIGVSGMRAPALGNAVCPGLGWLLAVCIVIGGAVFNIGNIAGGGLGLDALLGINTTLGGILTAGLAMGIFVLRRLQMALDAILVILGLVMAALTLFVVFTSHPPIGTALRNAVAPEATDWLVITTLVGGTVGGYITYAGAHRMLESGRTGVTHVRSVTRSSVLGILLTGVMRALLFLAVLGVVNAGANLIDAPNPAAAAFTAAAGEAGLRMFGVVLWAASLSSVVGASYTSASFLVPAGPEHQAKQQWVTIALIALSGAAFVMLGTAPAKLLVFAGAFNGLVLPVGLSVVIFVAAFRSHSLLAGYRYPRWLIALGVLALGVTWWLAWRSFTGVFALVS